MICFLEPNPAYWYGLSHRKCTVVGTVVGGKEDGTPVNVSLVKGAEGGIVGADMDNKPDTTEVIQRRFTVSLKSLFRKFNVPAVIDYLSLDVEGAEELIMHDFPFDEYRFRILTVERPNLALQALLKGNGYRFISMLIYFGETIWMHEDEIQSLGMSTISTVVLPHVEKFSSIKTNKKAFNMASGRMELKSNVRIKNAL